ncbi:DEAD/DEAH box helicase [Streptococcus oralis]|uniref:helicase-related protein n=1 Tax=Streptococcus oralis TaxID=1303 RepID=UPI0022842C9B|nr:DEAD/DEAH box helicase [Streptococcus oralis]MCY7080042.1 DEAD/DEAH box helicase [Streptococcus oralis]
MRLTEQQESAFQKFKELRVGALFMEQGTGKTRVALDLIRETDSDLVLFLCPYSTKSNLQAEIDKWGVSKEYFIFGYETISSSDTTYLKILDMVKDKKLFIVADESIFIKNENSKRYRRLMNIAKHSHYRLILNGTPITKDEWDIYNQMNFLSPKIIDMDRSQFLNTFFKRVKYKKRGQSAREFYKLSEVNIDYLHRLIEPYIFECSFQFDKKVKSTNIEIIASEETREKYETQKERLLNSLAIGEACIEQFQNLAVSCFDDTDRHKEIARHLKGQIIVFCTLLSEVEDISKEIDCYVITGAQSLKERSEIINKFKVDDKPLLMTIGTGAYGLNLQFCNKIAFASIAFDYGKIDQAKSRIRRLGQERDIEYTYFTSDLGIYKMIQENNQKKIDLKELIIERIKKGEQFENSL